MSKRVGSWLNICLGGLLILVSGCQPGADLKYNQGMTTSTAQKNAHSVNGTKAVMKPYTGNIELKLDTDLLKGYKGPHKVVPFATFSTKSKAGFKTQDLEAGPQVWQSELLTRTTGKPDEFDLTFIAPVGTYFLRVHNGDEQTDHRISSAMVSLNGAAVSVPDDYSQEVALVQKTVEVTTGGTQQVHVRLASKPGSFLRLEVLKTYDPFEPVFDPADPSSLGDLYPDVPGNKNVPVPETTEAVIALNGEPPADVSTGRISVYVKEPVQTNLQIILSRYNATVLAEPVAGFYPLLLDMTKIDLTNLEANLRDINTHMDDPNFIITTASFGNLESAKTFAAVAELKIGNLIEGVGFDPILSAGSTEPIGPLNTQESPGPHALDTIGYNTAYLGAQQSWWLNERSTYVTGAWNYALGYNREQQRAVRVAVIDGSFRGLYQSMQPGRELEGQILFDEGKRIIFAAEQGITINENLNWTLQMLADEDVDCHWDGFRCYPEKGTGRIIKSSSNAHGTRVIGTLASQINDGRGIAGVAPQSKIIPFKVGRGGGKLSWHEVTYAMLAITQMPSDKKIDVVNMSLWSGSPSHFMSYWAGMVKTAQNEWIEPSTETFLWWNPLNTLVNTLTQNKTVVVACAGNAGWNIFQNYPAGPKFPNILAVGAVEDIRDFSPPYNLQRAILQRVPNEGVFASPIPVSAAKNLKDYASNWGDGVQIWAPGRVMVAPGKDSGVPSDGLVEWSGTSAATPVVSGIVALIKSLNINASTTEIKNLLQGTAHDTRYVDSNLRDYPYKSHDGDCIEPGIHCGNPLPPQELLLKTVNARAAVASISNNVAQSFQGQIALDSSSYKFYDANSSDILTLSWGGERNNVFVGRLYLEDINYTPSQFKKISELNSGLTVQIDGWKNGNILHFVRIRQLTPVPFPTPISSVVPTPAVSPIPEPTPEPTPTATANPNATPVTLTWKVRAFNINDRAEVWVNDVKKIDYNYLGYNQYSTLQTIDPNWLKKDPNLTTEQVYYLQTPITFKVFNDSLATSGSAWGFELFANDQLVYRDVRGKSSGSDSHGARGNDPSLGKVYDETITISQKKFLPAGAYSVKVYNTSDHSKVKVNLLNTVIDSTGFDPFLLETVVNPYIVPEYNHINLQSFNDGGAYSWGFDVCRDGELVYRNRDGDKIQMLYYPSGANFNATTGCCNIPILDEFFSFWVF